MKVSEILKSILRDNNSQKRIISFGENKDFMCSSNAVQNAVMIVHFRFRGDVQSAIKYAESTGN